MEKIAVIVHMLNSFVWSNALVVLCLATGVYFTVSLKIPQIRFLKNMIALLLKSQETKGDSITPFQAFAATVGARVGMGSVAGVAMAVFYGGPGSVFWMWVLGLLGAGTALIESTLAQAYKIKQNGEYLGGPAVFIERGLNCRTYARLFALAAALGPGILMPGLHAYSVAGAMHQTFGIRMVTGGAFLCILLALVIFGGIKRIGRFAEKAAPLMCMIYFLMALGIAVIYIQRIPAVFGQILLSAFGQDALFGGIAGSALTWGIRRGVYSTEAGQGSGAIVCAAAKVSHPVKQGLVQALSVYMVSFVVITSTAVILLAGNSYNVINTTSGNMIVEYLPGKSYGAEWVQDILIRTYGSFWGGTVLTIVFGLFVFTSLVSYEYQAESNVNFLFQKKKMACVVIRCLFLISTFLGVVIRGDIIWSLGDTGAGMMAWLNLIAIILLSPKATAIFKDYENQMRQKKDPVFFPEAFQISDQQGIWGEFQKKKI